MIWALTHCCPFSLQERPTESLWLELDGRGHLLAAKLKVREDRISQCSFIWTLLHLTSLEIISIALRWVMATVNSTWMHSTRADSTASLNFLRQLWSDSQASVCLVFWWCWLVVFLMSVFVWVGFFSFWQYTKKIFFLCVCVYLL